MNDILLMLIIGFVAGGAVSSIIWAAIGSGGKKKAEAEAQARREISDAIVSLLTDADGIESKYRNGELTIENFRRNMGDKCNAALKVLRENMHSLDGFFVRYADQEIREYLRVADKPERRKEKPIFDSQSHGGAHAEPGATAAPAGIGAAIQSFGEDPSIMPAPTALKMAAAPEQPKIVEATGKPDLFEPSKPLSDIGPKIALKPHTEPEPAVKPAANAEPESVIDNEPEPANEPVIDITPEPEPADEPVIDITPEPEPADEPVIDITPEPEPDAKREPAGEESAFDLPVAAEAGADVWSEQSIEDFEAAFAKFEAETEAPQAAVLPQPTEALDEFETPTMEIPVSAVQSVKAAPAAPPVQEPSPVQEAAPVQELVAEPAAPANKSSQDEKGQDSSSSLGITGDDVSDALDNMFKF